jgi:V/A-type H+-transporting ATPase subunit I
MSGENVKVLCFSIGLVQLVVAHLKNIKRDLGSLKFVAQFGQLAMLAGMYVLALNLVINAGRFPIPGWAPLLIAAGFGVNFIFANYPSGRGFFKALGRSVLGSFGNIVSVFLGVVNIFADIVSYIRLWAVGLAGLAISQTINSMAGPLLGHLVFFLLGMILIVFGHGLNLIMSVLGVVVHGVRLNMLEFSGHLGMEWSGYKYAPFRDTTTPKGEKP